MAKRKVVKNDKFEIPEVEAQISNAMAMVQQMRDNRVQVCKAEVDDLWQAIQGVLTKHECAYQIQGQLPSGTWVPATDLGFIATQIAIVPNA